MAKRDDIKKQLKQQDDDFYGDQAIGGHQTSLDADDDAEEALADFIGNDPPKNLNIAEEIEDDEEEMRGFDTTESDMPAEAVPDADPRLNRLGSNPIDWMEENNTDSKKNE